jgi:hypothetical protein
MSDSAPKNATLVVKYDDGTERTFKVGHLSHLEIEVSNHLVSKFDGPFRCIGRVHRFTEYDIKIKGDSKGKGIMLFEGD